MLATLNAKGAAQMNRAHIRQNRETACIPRWSALAALAAVLALAPLASAFAQRVIVAPSYSSSSHGWTYSSSSSAYSSYYNSERYNSNNSCAYYGSHGYHRSDCGCGNSYYNGRYGRYYSGQRDWADSYYQRRRQEDLERRVKELKREEDQAREREARNARLEMERRERLDRIATLRADPEASRPKVYGFENPSIDEATTAYFLYHQRSESKTITRANPALAASRIGPAPAAGLTAVGVDDWTYYYKDGRFFTLEGETLTEVSAPIGALVFSLPRDRELAIAGEQPIYQCNGAYYQYTFVGNTPMYEVVEQPAPLASGAAPRDTVAMQ